jgi:hypothetical protein
MSAVIVGSDQGALVRDVLMDIPGSRYWHTTEAGLRHPAGKRVIKERIDYIASAADFNIVTVQTQIPETIPE